MARMPDAELADLAATVAVARLVLGPRDAHPGAAEPDRRRVPACCSSAGIDDWGGVSPLTPDHVNPERPWPQIDELAARIGRSGFHARRAADRLPATTCRRASRGSTRGSCRTSPRSPTRRRAGPRRRRAASAGLAGAGGRRGTVGRPRRPAHRDRHRRAARPTGATTSTASTATGRPCARRPCAPGAPRARSTRDVAAALRSAERDPAALSDADALALLHADGAELDAVAALADELRARRRSAATSPTSSTGTSTSPTSATPAAGSARSRSAAPTPTRTRCRWTRSATAPRRRGRSAPPRSACRAASIPDLPGTAYFDIAARGEGAGAGHARARVQPDGGRQRRGPHRAVDPRLADRGEGGRPRHDPGHRGRDPRRRRALAADQGQAAGARRGSRSSRTAHELGIRSSSRR